MEKLLKLASVDELLAFCEEAERDRPHVEAVRAMCDSFVESEYRHRLGALDPFSPAYATLALGLYRELADVAAYDPWVNERTPYIDVARSVTSPMPYQYRDSLTVSDFLLSWGWILRNLNIQGGGRVLEYGAGEAQLSIQLARMGCDVAIVDIDERYLDAVRAQCQSLGLTIELQKGQFGDPVRDRQFDRIIFFEAFHHALDHAAVLTRLKPLLAKNGFILFSGEPIVDPASVFVPFAWGPRLDGLSVRSTRKFGWCELGFQRPYFVERLMRCGYLVTHSPCPVTGRGDCFIATPTPVDTDIAVGAPYLFDLHGIDSGWYPGEVSHRWTSDHARLTLPDVHDFETATIRVVNHLPLSRHVTLRCGGITQATPLAAGERATLTITVPHDARRIEILTPAVQASALIPGNIDTRWLGIAVETLRFGGKPAGSALRPMEAAMCP